MNEKDFKAILAEVCEEEIAELNKFPPFKPSLRHRLAMKRVFTAFERNSRKTVISSPPISTSHGIRLNLKQRMIVIIAVIICAAFLTGFIVVYISSSFRGTVYGDNTQLFAVNTENGLPTIEYKYHLPELPDGFEFVEQSSSSFDVYTLYKNEVSGQVISLFQSIKTEYATHYNTEHHDLQEIEINGHGGLCIDFSNDERDSSIVIWDNDDYILQLSGNLDKESLLALAKSTKIIEK